MGQIEDKQQNDRSKINYTNNNIKWSKHTYKEAEIVRLGNISISFLRKPNLNKKDANT